MAIIIDTMDKKKADGGKPNEDIPPQGNCAGQVMENPEKAEAQADVAKPKKAVAQKPEGALDNFTSGGEVVSTAYGRFVSTARARDIADSLLKKRSCIRAMKESIKQAKNELETLRLEVASTSSSFEGRELLSSEVNGCGDGPSTSAKNDTYSVDIQMAPLVASGIADVPEKSSNKNYWRSFFAIRDMKTANLNRISNLPESVQNRIDALKDLQSEKIVIDMQYSKEYHAIKMKYNQQAQALYKIRSDIISGKVELPKMEKKYNDKEYGALFDFSDDIEQMKQLSSNIVGLPKFWLEVFRTTKLLADIISDDDIPVLQKLRDVTFEYGDINTPYCFTIYFHFDENEYFEDKVLTKKYYMEHFICMLSTLDYKGFQIRHCKGCKINWKPGKDLTILCKEKEKISESGAIETHESFFEFFDPPSVPVNLLYMSEDEEDIYEYLQMDFKIGLALVNKIIPNAILMLTGDRMLDNSKWLDIDKDDERMDKMSFRV